MSKDTSFDCELHVVTEPVGERSKVTATLDITDSGQPFANNTMIWHDVPDEGVDYIMHLFSEIAGNDVSVSVKGISEKKILLLERKALGALMKLNDLGEESVGKSRAEKAQAGKALVAALGAQGKGKGLGRNK
jgi:hypothetical protein